MNVNGQNQNQGLNGLGMSGQNPNGQGMNIGGQNVNGQGAGVKPNMARRQGQPANNGNVVHGQVINNGNLGANGTNGMNAGNSTNSMNIGNGMAANMNQQMNNYGQQINAAASSIRDNIVGNGTTASFEFDKQGNLGFRLGIYTLLAALLYMFGSMGMLIELFIFVAIVEKNNGLNKILLTIGLSLITLLLVEDIWNIAERPISILLSKVNGLFDYGTFLYDATHGLYSGWNTLDDIVAIVFDALRIIIGYKFIGKAKKGTIKMSKIVEQYLN